MPLECLQARPALAKVILCMRHFLVGSLLISGFCSHGPPFALPSLSPEAFYTRELFAPEPLNTTKPLHHFLLHHKFFAPETFYIRDILHYRRFTPQEFYTRELFAPEPLNTTKPLHHFPLHHKFFAPETFYIRDILHYRRFAPQEFYTRELFAPEPLLWCKTLVA